MSKIPSIAVIPSGYKGGEDGKDGTVYSVLPTNGDADLNFTRNCVATRVNQDGLLEEVGLNVPRLDYLDGGCPSLLLEPQTTNLLEYSETFTDTYWSKTGIFSVSRDTNINDPKGNTFASILIPSSVVGGNKSISKSFTTLTGINTFSVFVKKEGFRYVMIRNRSGGARAVLDFDTGLVSEFNSVSLDLVSSKVDALPNGWFRLQATFDADITNTFPSISMNDDGTSNVFVGDDVRGSYIYEAQFEEGFYATSYIPTDGATVTRFQDEAEKGSLESYINSSEGVLYAEAKWDNTVSTDRITITDANGFSNSVSFRSTSNNNFQMVLLTANANESVFNINKSDFDFNNNYMKIAVSYKLNETKLFLNGSQFGTTDTECLMPIGMSRISIQKGVTAKEIRVYQETLTDAELIALTQ